MTASRVSHSTSSNGWTPSLVKKRLNDSPFSFTETSRSFVAMTPPVRLSGKDYIGVIRGAYYTPEAERCQASFSQYVALSGENLPREPQHLVVPEIFPSCTSGYGVGPTRPVRGPLPEPPR